MDNKTIAAVFEEMGDILDIQGADFFRINAYRKAALTIRDFPHDLRKIVEENPINMPKIPGIGTVLREKIIELIENGNCEEHEEMKKNFPSGLLEMLKLRGVGPKKVKLFFYQLKITSLHQLKKAAEEKKLRELEGMGPKSEEDILTAIKEYSTFSTKRHLISTALKEAEKYIDYMKKCKHIDKITYAGSLRRCEETIGDIDILVTIKGDEKNKATVSKHFVEYEDVVNVVAEGKTKSAVFLESGIDVDLRVLKDDEFGAALHYFTGSKAHNIKMRDIAKNKGLKINEYGVFKGDKKIGGKTEKEIFDSVGLPFIIPELRKNDGEIEYAQKHKKIPKFVDVSDIKGDLHSHSVYSDGKRTIKEMAETFISLGYEYFAITDHSSLVGVSSGMGTKEIKKQWAEVDKLRVELDGKIKILKGCEVDILKDGSLDFGEEVLKELDIVLISAHLYNRMPADQQTKRMIAAIENPYSQILCHPTGRLLNKRAEMEFDMEKVIDACIANKVSLEINASPSRLDLSDKYLRIAKDKGAKFVINSDSHDTSHPAFITFGVGIARRGWLEPDDVLNTFDFKRLTQYLRRL
jgi:DNA polymerase (family X)